jgi:1-deoxy-D-xylulose-5-phosphate reductoisomerase
MSGGLMPPDSAIAKIILTASGGPFRTWSLADLANVTVEHALNHPTWKMGKKITIDSATLMNKALEIIEARWLFDVPASKIDVVIHPQSLVHSMVEFVDGSVIAQMSPPDMRLPIQLALYYPHRFPGPALKVDWKQAQTLEFYPPDFERFPALLLGLEAAASGGTAGAVINAANEEAVSAFLGGKLPFQDIVNVCKSVLHNHDFEPHPTLEQLLSIDRWARKEAEKWK